MKEPLEINTDNLITRIKAGDFSIPSDDISQTVIKLASLPKSRAPRADFARIKLQVLDRIAVPAEVQSSGVRSIFLSLPRILRLTSGLVATLLVAGSLTFGTMAAALQSAPGSPIYPLKKVAENLQLKFAQDYEEKANLQIKFANNRLEELEKVLKQTSEGKLSDEKAQKIMTAAVKDLQKNTAAASVAGSKTNADLAILTKIVSLSNKQTAVLKTASITTEGETKIEIEKAIETSKISKEQAIENIERAGLVVEEQPLQIEEKLVSANKITMTGKLTSVTSTSISIGTAKFLLTKDTKYVNITQDKLAADQLVDIQAEIVDDKTMVTQITLVKTEVQAESVDTQTQTETLE